MKKSKKKTISDIERDIKYCIDVLKLNDEQHFTDPPPRYSEASLVKKMEELGIGRPSTYASIILSIQKRFSDMQIQTI